MNVLITGASSGIGAALAEEYAKRSGGRGWLFLCGRDSRRLDAIASKCRECGCLNVRVQTLNVTDSATMSEWIRRCDRDAPLDIVHANAGVSTGVETENNVRNTFAVNVDGVLNTVLPAIELFRNKSICRTRRQIAITASIAGYHGLATCPAYSGSKAGVKAWGEGLRGMLANEGIMVNVICPGFVRSRITDANTCPMPFFWEADKAARVIVDRLDRNVGLIAFPWPLRLATWLASILPNRISDFIYNLLPPKN